MVLGDRTTPGEAGEAHEPERNALNFCRGCLPAAFTVPGYRLVLPWVRSHPLLGGPACTSVGQMVEGVARVPSTGRIKSGLSGDK